MDGKEAVMEEKSVVTQDERVMAGLAHMSVLIPFMGIVAPVVIWATHKDKSEFIRFQALQAVAYQLTMFLTIVLSFLCYFVSFLIAFLGTFAGIMTPLLAQPSGGSETPVSVLVMLVSMLPAFLPFLVFGVLVILILAFIFYGVIGAVMVFQGSDFRYIVIGKRIEKYLSR
jgi:uncharacterized Tic20 family protein